MSRRATRQLTLQFVLRTFARLRMIANRYDAEWLTKDLAPYRERIEYPAQFAADMVDYMRAAGPIKHPDCAQCGAEILLDHNGARYCSARCRQRAWRERRAAAEGRNAAPAKRRRRFNRVRDEMKRRATPLDDASSTPGDETNVTRVGVSD